MFDFFKTESKLLLDLMNTGFTIVETGLFYGGEHLEQNYADSRLFWRTWPYLLEADDM